MCGRVCKIVIIISNAVKICGLVANSNACCLWVIQEECCFANNIVFACVLWGVRDTDDDDSWLAFWLSGFLAF